MLERKEVFVERDREFSRKDLLRVKCVIVPKLLQDFPCLGAGISLTNASNTSRFVARLVLSK
jgi:hypothetical protein